jgi:hypothetical protein
VSTMTLLGTLLMLILFSWQLAMIALVTVPT